jgi:hypothetical protein
MIVNTVLSRRADPLSKLTQPLLLPIWEHLDKMIHFSLFWIVNKSVSLGETCDSVCF